MSTTENEQLVLDFFETLSSGDLEKLRTMLHEEASWTTMVRDLPGAGEHKGRTGVIDEFLGPIRGMFEPGDPKVHVQTIISKGPMVAAETLGKGRLKNGKTYDNTYCWMIEIRDGLVYSVHEYMDSLYVSALFD